MYSVYDKCCVISNKKISGDRPLKKIFTLQPHEGWAFEYTNSYANRIPVKIILHLT